MGNDIPRGKLRYLNIRYNGTENPIERIESAGRSLETLILVDMRFNGCVIEITPTKLVTRTPGYGFYDIVTYEGHEQDMAPLILLAVCYTLVRADPKNRASVANSLSGIISQLPGERKPTMIEALVPLLAGSHACKIALLAATEVTDPRLADTLAKMELKELAPIMALAIECKVSPAEVLAMTS